MATKWWLKYQDQPDILVSAAKESWQIYLEITTKADQKLTRAWVENPTKSHKQILDNWEIANKTAQPLLEDWMEICQKLNQVIR